MLIKNWVSFADAHLFRRTSVGARLGLNALFVQFNPRELKRDRRIRDAPGVAANALRAWLFEVKVLRVLAKPIGVAARDLGNHTNACVPPIWNLELHRRRIAVDGDVTDFLASVQVFCFHADEREMDLGAFSRV